jgi:hypothetical protein
MSTNAIEVAPLLLERFRLGRSADKILLAETLWKIGGHYQETLPYLVNELHTKLDPYRENRVITVLGLFGPKAASAAPVLFQMLQTRTNRSELFERATIQALGKIGAMPELVLPYILARIPSAPNWSESTRAVTAIEALGGFGPPGIDHLLNFYRSTNAILRWPCTNSMPIPTQSLQSC